MYKEKQLFHKIYINSKAFNINVNKISSENIRFLKIEVNIRKNNRQLTALQFFYVHHQVQYCHLNFTTKTRLGDTRNLPSSM
jgi:hypothetical protein